MHRTLRTASFIGDTRSPPLWRSSHLMASGWPVQVDGSTYIIYMPLSPTLSYPSVLCYVVTCRCVGYGARVGVGQPRAPHQARDFSLRGRGEGPGLGRREQEAAGCGRGKSAGEAPRTDSHLLFDGPSLCSVASCFVLCCSSPRSSPGTPATALASWSATPSACCLEPSSLSAPSAS